MTTHQERAANGPDEGGRRLTGTGYVGFVLIGWNAVLVPALIRSVEHDLRQSDAAFGLFFLISSLFYAGGSFGGGLLTERIGRRVVLAAGGVLLGVGLAGEGLAPGWALIIAAAVLVNVGAGALDGGINGLFLDLFRDSRGGSLNLLHLFFSVGALIAPFAAGLLVNAGASWRAILISTSGGALLLVLLLLWAPMPSGRHDSTIAPAVDEITGAERSLVPFAALAVSIGLYVGAELGVSNWVVKMLEVGGAPLPAAAAVLSIFWGGVTLGRFLSNWVAERLDYYAFTVACVLLGALSLFAAVLAPWLPLSAALFGLTGLFYGPIYPMIMALGGNIYPHRLSALSGSLAATAVVGAVGYPPLMGFMAARIGLHGGMIGAAALGIPCALAVLVARGVARSLARRSAAELAASSADASTGESQHDSSRALSAYD